MKRNCTAQIPESIPLMTQVTRDSSSAVQMYGICYIRSSIWLERCGFSGRQLDAKIAVPLQGMQLCFDKRPRPAIIIAYRERRFLHKQRKSVRVITVLQVKLLGTPNLFPVGKVCSPVKNMLQIQREVVHAIWNTRDFGAGRKVGRYCSVCAGCGQESRRDLAFEFAFLYSMVEYQFPPYHSRQQHHQG